MVSNYMYQLPSSGHNIVLIAFGYCLALVTLFFYYKYFYTNIIRKTCMCCRVMHALRGLVLSGQILWGYPRQPKKKRGKLYQKSTKGVYGHCTMGLTSTYKTNCSISQTTSNLGKLVSRLKQLHENDSLLFYKPD